MIGLALVSMLSLSATDFASLEDAVAIARESSAPVEIRLLTSGIRFESEVFIEGDVRIIGSDTALEGKRAGGRLFSVMPGSSLTLDSVEISRGRAVEGGLVLNHGNLWIRNSSLSRGQAWSGGSIYNSGFLYLENVDLRKSGNFPAEGFGGGGGHIFNSGHLIMDRVFCYKGQARLGYGGCLNNNGIADITNTTIYGNRARLGNCGGIANFKDITINNSTIARNQANGGMEDLLSKATGGLCGFGPNTEISNSIFEGNFDAQHGGQGKWNCAGEIASLGGNVDTSSSCGGIGDRLLSDIRLRLSSPEYLKARMPTLEIPAGSDADDFGIPQLCEAVDARNLPRGQACDSGAYERQ